MSEIDAEKLQRAVDYYSYEASRIVDPENAARAQILVKAARSHLATLPRFKEVEVEKWAVMRGSGEMVSCLLYDSEEEASRVEPGSGITVFRLTGTAKVKVTP